MREDMNKLPGKTLRNAYATKWGMSVENTPLQSISPALDIVLGRPGDPAHSEYNGLANMMHSLLLDTILTTAATRSYAALLRVFPFPPSWPRVQGPLRYLKSYSLSEHARWSVVVPVLLRCWLPNQHIQPWLLGILSEGGWDPVQRIVDTYASAARSNCVLMGTSLSAQDRVNMESTIVDHRAKLQSLLSSAAASSTANTRHSRTGEPSQVPRGQTSVRGATPAFAAGQIQAVGAFGAFHAKPPAEIAKRAQTYLNDMKRPNMHTALHNTFLADEYALPVNQSVLQGEDKHRFFKKIIYDPNHRDAENSYCTEKMTGLPSVLSSPMPFKRPKQTSP
jgi:hypothetical protein